MQEAKAKYNMIVEILSDLIYGEIVKEDAAIEACDKGVMIDENCCA